VRLVAVLGAAAVVGALLLISAFARSPSHGCPNTGDPTGKPISGPAERALVTSTFSAKTIDRCWPGTRR
jgi:hypothetical protein